jgi:hypothetical protein
MSVANFPQEKIAKTSLFKPVPLKQKPAAWQLTHYWPKIKMAYNIQVNRTANNSGQNL